MNDWTQFRKACDELETWLRARIEAHGIVFECRTDSPGTMEVLRATRGPLPVPTYAGRPDTIYSGGGCNKCLYQAYHDHFHRVGPECWDFTYPGEYAIAVDHQREARVTGLSDDACRVLWVESWVRVAYHAKWGRFPRNEGLFHWLAFTQGVHYAVDAEGV